MYILPKMGCGKFESEMVGRPKLISHFYRISNTKDEKNKQKKSIQIKGLRKSKKDTLLSFRHFYGNS